MQVALEQAGEEAVHFRKAKRLGWGHISRLRSVGAGGEIADGLAQGNGMLAHNKPPITAGLPQIWLELPQPDTGLLRCIRRSENEGSPERASHNCLPRSGDVDVLSLFTNTLSA